MGECQTAMQPGPTANTLMLGEDYFESLTLLRAVESAGSSFVAIEIGSSYGYWSVKAAFAWHRKHPGLRNCAIVLVEPNAEYLERAPAHLEQNDVWNICNVSIINEFASAALLDRLILEHQIVNLLH